MRYQKVVNKNGVETARYNYVYADGQLILLSYTANGTTQNAKFVYGSTGEVLGFIVDGVSQYLYVKNLQGDIVAIVNESGVPVVRYIYDAWGNVTIVPETSYENLVNLSPFAYRGYCYDNDIKMYYLQSRYYDPQICRFINADSSEYLGATETVLSYNLFAYCENDPVNCVDNSGCFSFKIYAVAAISAAIIGAISKILANYFNGVRGWKLFRGVLGSAIGNSVNIVLLMRFISKGNTGIVLAAFVAAVVQALIDFIEDVMVDKKYNWNQLTYNLILNFACILVGNYLGGKTIYINGYWFQPQKISSFFFKSYGKKLLSQTGIGSVISIAIDLVKNRLQRKLNK